MSEVKVMELVYEPGRTAPTLERFHASNEFVRFVRGPFGSGKSVAMCWEIWTRATEQWAGPDGIRRSRWLATRNTYGDLTQTTMKTWLDWFPEKRFGKVRGNDSPITQTCRWPLADGTKVELEVLFMALDSPENINRLMSLDLTGAWMNECRAQEKSILDALTGRVGRYPSALQGGCKWSGVIGDTNSPDDDHWLYRLERDKPNGFAFFEQPPGDSEDGENHAWLNQTAETLELDLEDPRRKEQGRQYYERLKLGKTAEWIKVYVKGKYGTVHDGKPIYPEWNEQYHLAKDELRPIQGICLDIGMDFGLTPAAVITQTDARGRLLVLDEVCTEDMAIRQFLQDALIPKLVKDYEPWWKKKDKLIRVFGDPAGTTKAQTDERTCFQEIRSAGLIAEPARTNGFVARRGAVAWFLNKMTGGSPAFLLSPKCDVLRKGFNGGYKYRRLQIVGKEAYTQTPDKRGNPYSHPHDALQYAALHHGGVQAYDKELDEIRLSAPKLAGLGFESSPTGVLG